MTSDELNRIQREFIKRLETRQSHTAKELAAAMMRLELFMSPESRFDDELTADDRTFLRVQGIKP